MPTLKLKTKVGCVSMAAGGGKGYNISTLPKLMWWQIEDGVVGAKREFLTDTVSSKHWIQTDESLRPTFGKNGDFRYLDFPTADTYMDGSLFMGELRSKKRVVFIFAIEFTGNGINGPIFTFSQGQSYAGNSRITLHNTNLNSVKLYGHPVDGEDDGFVNAPTYPHGSGVKVYMIDAFFDKAYYKLYDGSPVITHTFTPQAFTTDSYSAIVKLGTGGNFRLYEMMVLDADAAPYMKVAHDYFRDKYIV